MRLLTIEARLEDDASWTNDYASSAKQASTVYAHHLRISTQPT